MSSGHSSSAYSLLWVMPIGSVITAPTIAACQPQNTNRASLSEISRKWQVRWTTYSEVANSPEPPKAKINPLVCSGRRDRQSVVEGKSVSERVDHGGRCISKKKKTSHHYIKEN